VYRFGIRLWFWVGLLLDSRYERGDRNFINSEISMKLYQLCKIFVPSIFTTSLLNMMVLPANAGIFTLGEFTINFNFNLNLNTDANNPGKDLPFNVLYAETIDGFNLSLISNKNFNFNRDKKETLTFKGLWTGSINFSFDAGVSNDVLEAFGGQWQHTLPADNIPHMGDKKESEINTFSFPAISAKEQTESVKMFPLVQKIVSHPSKHSDNYITNKLTITTILDSDDISAITYEFKGVHCQSAPPAPRFLNPSTTEFESCALPPELPTVPEPTSTISLIALGTLGAASTLKRKLKSSKPSEKETTKVS
jgi:hypothetical protein